MDSDFLSNRVRKRLLGIDSVEKDSSQNSDRNGVAAPSWAYFVPEPEMDTEEEEVSPNREPNYHIAKQAS